MGRSRAARNAAPNEAKSKTKRGTTARSSWKYQPPHFSSQNQFRRQNASPRKGRRKHVIFDDHTEETRFVPGEICYPHAQRHFVSGGTTMQSSTSSSSSSSSSSSDEANIEEVKRALPSSNMFRDGQPERIAATEDEVAGQDVIMPQYKKRKLDLSLGEDHSSSPLAARGKLLNLLGANELSATYGKGFQLLARMGFKPGETLGQRKDGLVAPLKAHNQGRSRRGVQSIEEMGIVDGAADAQSEDDLDRAQLATRREELLSSFLESMRQVGDLEEADELLRLARSVGLSSRNRKMGEMASGGPVASGQASQSFFATEQLLENDEDTKGSAARKHKPRARNRGSSLSSSSSVDPGDALAAAAAGAGGGSGSGSASAGAACAPNARLRLGEEKALTTLWKRLVNDLTFPVELERQATALLWRRRFQEELGTFEDFLQRWPDHFRVLCCPGGVDRKLVLPAAASSPVHATVGSNPRVEVDNSATRLPVLDVIGFPRRTRWDSGSGTGSSSQRQLALTRLSPPSEAKQLGDVAGKYTSWCHKQRCAARGQSKKKWRHFEQTVRNFCKQMVAASIKVEPLQVLKLGSKNSHESSDEVSSEDAGQQECTSQEEDLP